MILGVEIINSSPGASEPALLRNCLPFNDKGGNRGYELALVTLITSRQIQRTHLHAQLVVVPNIPFKPTPYKSEMQGLIIR